MATATVSGPVLSLRNFAGTSEATGRPFDLTFARVLVADRDVTEVMLPPQLVAHVAQGDVVDLLVELGVNRGNVSIRAYPDQPAAPAALHVAV